MRINTEHPFKEYIAYKIFHEKMGRWQVSLIDSKSNRTTILYSKYIMSIKLGRILGPEEEVDHKDEDKTNDHPDNIQVISKTQNIIKHNINKEDKETFKFTCHCGKVFIRDKQRSYQARINGKQISCSRKCAYSLMRVNKFYLV
jgi:HNH endonuclease